MATKVEYSKDSDLMQLSQEKSMIIDVLKAKVPKAKSGQNRAIKLPKYIFFDIKADAILSIHIREMDAIEDGNAIKKNPVCENMQTDNAAFEGWAICLKSWLDNIEKVELRWDIPSYETLQNGSSKQHYNRFCYRVMRFHEAFSDWFIISKDNQIEISNFALEFADIQNNAYSKEPEHKPSLNGFGETDMEYAMANDLKGKMLFYFNLDDIDRQFPVGLKKNNKQFFTGGLSAIDLWGTKENVLSLIELKYGTKNIKVGIVSELFLYSCVMRDMIKGVIEKPSSTISKASETAFYENARKYRQVKAYMLANEYHPLIENDAVLNLLNSNKFANDISILFLQRYYTYNETSKQLKIIG